ncbi:hypothetical protein [Oligella urethralis]|nr:hypothetical protein [Oligella urethralis]
MSSLFLMAFILFYLLFKDGSEAVGYFSGITTTVAPLVMFSQYRFAEYLSLAKEKRLAYQVSLTSSLMTYCLFGSIMFIIAIFFNIDIKLLTLMLLYKFFELYSDIYIAYLSIIKQFKKAFFAVSIRVFSVLVFSIIVFFVEFDSSVALVETILTILFLVYAITFFVNFVHEGPKLQFVGVKGYVVCNYSYALTSIFVSLNSLVPRYFFMFYGNYSGLGVFSIIYLLSSNSVNILQYPISLKSDEIKKVLNKFNLKVFLFSIICLVMCLVLFYLLESFYYFSIVVGVLSMFLMLLLRGVYITYSITNALKHKVNFSVICSALISSLIVYAFIKIQNRYDIMFAIIYVLFSAFITITLLCFYNYKSIRER